MNILINASNINIGGGIQVADSICRELRKYPQHFFTVILSSKLSSTKDAIESYSNVKAYIYDVKNSIRTLVFGRDGFLDSLVANKKIDVVMTVFGPSKWNPKVKHLSGFALPHLVIPESPFFYNRSFKKQIHDFVRYKILAFEFRRSAKCFYTENPFISERLQRLLKNKKIYTVTNYYNQLYDHPEQWVKKKLPDFDGITLLTITASYPHKNLEISSQVARELMHLYPHFKFRFVFSVNRDDFKADINGIENCFVFLGRVGTNECPSLYQQSDIMFQPSLLECFSATYPEAMRMRIPIVTTDLEFAKGLCGSAAEYYSSTNVHECAEAIYKVATNAKLRSILVENGERQLKLYDTYNQRAEKLIKILEKI